MPLLHQSYSHFFALICNMSSAVALLCNMHIFLFFKAQCQAGTVSNTEYQPCLPCTQGTYSISRSGCSSCPVGETTPSDGADDEADCSVIASTVGKYNKSTVLHCLFYKFTTHILCSACIYSYIYYSYKVSLNVKLILFSQIKPDIFQLKIFQICVN